MLFETSSKFTRNLIASSNSLTSRFSEPDSQNLCRLCHEPVTIDNSLLLLKLFVFGKRQCLEDIDQHVFPEVNGNYHFFCWGNLDVFSTLVELGFTKRTDLVEKADLPLLREMVRRVSDGIYDRNNLVTSQTTSPRSRLLLPPSLQIPFSIFQRFSDK